jgi:UDP-N-acetylglucosamine 2-epimerase (non-hydrolysing)
VKLHPVALALAAAQVETILIATNQHRSAPMKDAFLRKLDWPCAVETLPVQSTDSLAMLGEIMTVLPRALRERDCVVAEGDTTSVLAAHLVANRLSLRLAHVEAGLRSYDLRMPEEHNRRLCDHLADELFAPTEFDASHLREEHVPGAIHVVGNTVLDAVRQNAARISALPTLAENYVLLTLHRQENVDDVAFLVEMRHFLDGLAIPCVFPVHPRTRSKLAEAELWARVTEVSRVRVLEPLDYLSFLGAMRHAAVIVTDSGGVQEEATAPEIRRPVIVVRRSTERVPAIDAGFSVLAPAQQRDCSNS